MEAALLIHQIMKKHVQNGVFSVVHPFMYKPEGQ